MIHWSVYGWRERFPCSCFITLNYRKDTCRYQKGPRWQFRIKAFGCRLAAFGKREKRFTSGNASSAWLFLYMIIDGGVGGLEYVFRLRMRLFVGELIEQRRRRSSSIRASHWTPIFWRLVERAFGYWEEGPIFGPYSMVHRPGSKGIYITSFAANGQ